MMLKIKISNTYKNLFNDTPIFFRSPGRINLIGEHTDYNDGFVLPAAIDKAIYLAVGKRTDGFIHLYSIDYNDYITIDINDIAPLKNWSTYILGVVSQLIQNGYNVNGFNMVIGGDVPIGAGLSSSAAIECAAIYALNQLFDFNISKIDLVKMAQKAEHEFAGVKCGIMDQFASMFGKEDRVIKLDCKSLEYTYFPLILDEYQIVLFDTQVKHSLANSEYNIRRTQCEEGIAAIQKKYPQVNSLRKANLTMLSEVLEEGTLVYNRCKYVIEEIERVEIACKYLENNELQTFGAKMFETHDGLSKLYDVSCKELDFLVQQARLYPSIIGARMMGGGFGGCTINIIEKTALDDIIEKITDAYEKRMNKKLETYVVSIESGTSQYLEHAF